MKLFLSHNRNGVVLHEDAVRAVIATGLTRPSTNEKTGAMVQVWILHRTLHPLEAIRTGEDRAICGTCEHLGKRDDAGKVTGRRCYVQVDKAPSQVWRAYQRGRYRKARANEYPALFAGRKVRFGAYGDPAYIPKRIVTAIAAAADGHTGYTQQWRNAKLAWLQAYVMASAASERAAAEAAAKGWRYFRVRGKDAPVSKGEIVCPASEEGGKRTTCLDCRLCNGRKPADPRKNIVIIDHSMIAKSQPLVQITVAP